MTREEAIKELKNIKESIFWGDEYGVSFRDEWVEAYEMAISALREQTKLATNLQPEASFSCKWISVEERLPEENGYYLCWRNKEVKMLFWEDNLWLRQHNLLSTVNFVTHWMPLPEPPKGEE